MFKQEYKFYTGTARGLQTSVKAGNDDSIKHWLCSSALSYASGSALHWRLSKSTFPRAQTPGIIQLRNKERTQEKSKQLVQSQQHIWRLHQLTCFLLRNWEGRKRLSTSEQQHYYSCIRGALLIQTRLQWSKGCCRLHRSLSWRLTEHFWVRQWGYSLHKSRAVRAQIRKAPKLVSIRTSPPTSAIHLEWGMPWTSCNHLLRGGKGKSQPTSQSQSNKRFLEPQILQLGQHQVNARNSESL